MAYSFIIIRFSHQQKTVVQNFGCYRRKLELHDELARQQTDKAKLVDDLSEVRRQAELERIQLQQNKDSLMATIGEYVTSLLSLTLEL